MIIMILLLSGISSSFAEDITDVDQLPDLEMLEYLGSWGSSETKDGEWFDPMQLFELAEYSIPAENEKRRADDSND